MANHQHPIAVFGGTKELAAFRRRDANGFLQESMFTRLECRQRKWHVRKVGRGNNYRIEVTLDEVFFFFEQRHIRRDLYCPPDASGIARAQRNGHCLFAAVLVEQLQMTESHRAHTDESHANFSRHNGGDFA